LWDHFGKVTKPVDQARTDKFQEDGILVMSIIAKFVRDHLIAYIVDHKSSKEMYDVLLDYIPSTTSINQ